MHGGTLAFATYLVVILVFAVLTAWPGPCCNNPVCVRVGRQRVLMHEKGDDEHGSSKLRVPNTKNVPTPTPRRFAEIVPASKRNLVYAFDRCFEGAVAAFAAPLVGVLAEKWYGFSGTSTVTGDAAKDLANARALGSALLTFLTVPWCICFCVYSGELWEEGTGGLMLMRM